jgi:hypothetical protein
VRNEIETKRNQQKWNETKSTKWKRNQRKQNEINGKQNEIENGRKNNKGLKEIKHINKITMLDDVALMWFPNLKEATKWKGQTPAE